MISIILPAYNEEKNIFYQIRDVENFFKKENISHEIIVVNDGSGDNTGKILENIKKTKKIIIVSHKKNLGYGAALKSGFKVASGNLIFFTDSDRQFDIQDISLFLKEIDKYDFIAGYRSKRNDPLIRIFYASVFRFSAGLFFGIKLRDIDCAFKLFKSYVTKDDFVSNGALINLEILARAKKRGYKFIELPVKHFSRREGKQTGGSLRVIFKAIAQFFSLYLSSW